MSFENSKAFPQGLSGKLLGSLVFVISKARLDGRDLRPIAVQTLTGHSSLTVTMDRYGHLFPSDDHKVAMDAIAGELMG